MEELDLEVASGLPTFFPIRLLPTKQPVTLVGRIDHAQWIGFKQFVPTSNSE